MEKPQRKPNNPCFSSGPCAKRPGWSLDALKSAMLGRSHRAGPLKAQLKEVIDLHKEILGIPAGYRVGIVPASDTGAFEMALWSMLGVRGVDVFAWESFSNDWLKDVTGQLKISDTRTFEAPYGKIPDLAQADPKRDTVFVWNGTTSGVRVANGEWINADREGLTFCDATSAVFAYDLPWDKLDVVTWSWQKVLGGEAAHGMLVLSPRAVERLESYKPDRALPKIFRMTAKGKLNEALFEGSTINTPSMLAVEDCLDALRWVKSIGGLQGTIKRTADNFAVFENWVSKTDWIEFLSETSENCSKTSVCLKITDGWFSGLADADKEPFIKGMVKLLVKEGAAYDIAGYRDAPAGLRIWCGATVEKADVETLIPWIEWAFAKAKADAQAQKAA
ncbi:MAG: phosphoserine transaminase [Rhodospirillales bacterium]|nr:phosphoserine transaminase [Alphaproteobacteria bacterium]MCB1840036.1 phosphoserine transaminase [Alphaproteobacteria bacterium]MCB9977064.1 phosphoserine transaminase [Rhodospirillales bacterium]